MRLITISRQFGSGGRELGKRLSDILGWDYYDREIIEAVAREQGMDEDYVHRVLSRHGWHNYQLTYRNSFHQPLGQPGHRTELLVQERKVIREIAKAGNDCIIVGRDADVILQEEQPFRIFVCADLSFRLERCMKHEEKQPEEERLTEKAILRNIRRIDRNRRQTREILTGKDFGDAGSFDLTVNTARWDIKKLTEAVADFSRRWFECNGK
ncbi:MAG: cytidylate kinase-like family protein [Clostridia bacterium]|nr:cytidylate kinase-like family protein [Clostridia bacterium]